MKRLLPILIFVTSCWTQSDKPKSNHSDSLKVVEISNKPKIISDSTNKLTGKIENLVLVNIVFGCACADWVKEADFKKYTNNYKELTKYSMFIEPANQDLELPIYFSSQRHKIKVQGQFYERPDYPKGTVQGEEELAKSKVFRYSKLEVCKKDLEYSTKDDKTITLSYNSISCECAQWSESKLITDTAKREYIYLEPANEEIINADDIYNGENLPIQIQVKGQIVDYAGFPTGYNPKKGNPISAKVFRYTKIKVLKNGH